MDDSNQFVLIIVLAIFLFHGEPDVADALIVYLMK